MKRKIVLFCLLCCGFWFALTLAHNEPVEGFTFLVGNQEEILNNGYSRGLNNAYQFAYHYWITTMDWIENAKMHGPLHRIAMAKMLANYATKVLKKTPNLSARCSFSDVSDALDLSYDYWAKLACQLGIMWIGADTFRPYEETTRAEFATALGRLAYQIPDWKDFYYTPHLEKLNSLWVIKNTDPTLKEVRWYVMLMLMRTVIGGEVPSFTKPSPTFVAVIQDPSFYTDTAVVYVYDPLVSGLPKNKGIKIQNKGYERGDLVEISFDWDIEGLNSGSYAKIQHISSMKKIWSIKEKYFIKRNNIPNELQYSWYQEKPIINYEVHECSLDNRKHVKNETGYSYVFEDLRLKISTPICWRSWFPAANANNLFVRNGVEIRKTWNDKRFPWRIEYVKIYAKNPDQSLEELIKVRHLNPWCKLEKWIASKGFDWLEGTGYYIVDWIEDWTSYEARSVKCFPDDEDNYSIAGEAHIQFFEQAKDSSRYYKVRFQDSPSIFWKIETL